MNVLCPSCKTMVSFEEDRVEPVADGDIWWALVMPPLIPLCLAWQRLKSLAGDDLSTCPSCGESLFADC